MKKVLLLVDDTLTVRMFEKVALGDSYEYVEAVNGKLALAATDKRKPDAILLDLMMPEMNGIETLRELKTRETTKDIPVIMVTTKSEEDVKRECRELGAYCFVTKPIDRDELRLRVQEAVGASA
ncbi:MAG: response regulator [Myxococcaceae bacterium]